MGGRTKGSKNKLSLTKSSSYLNDLADKLNVDPFQILLHFAAGDWKALGYDSPVKQKVVGHGVVIEEEVIPAGFRLKGAMEAAKYLYPQKRAVEVTHELTKEEEMLLELFRERIKNYVQDEALNVVNAKSIPRSTDKKE